MPRLDAVGWIRSYLADGLDGTEVRVRVPEERPGEFVTVTRNGGRRLNALLDRAGIDILCWAGTAERAWAMASDVSDLMLALNGGHILDGVDLVEEAGCRYDPDIRTGTPRWYLSYTVTTHKYSDSQG